VVSSGWENPTALVVLPPEIVFLTVNRASKGGLPPTMVRVNGISPWHTNPNVLSRCSTEGPGIASVMVGGPTVFEPPPASTAVTGIATAPAMAYTHQRL